METKDPNGAKVDFKKNYMRESLHMKLLVTLYVDSPDSLPLDVKNDLLASLPLTVWIAVLRLWNFVIWVKYPIKAVQTK